MWSHECSNHLLINTKQKQKNRFLCRILDSRRDVEKMRTDVFVLIVNGQSAVMVTGRDSQLCLCVCLLAVCINAGCVFPPPQAPRWRGCTAWQGRTWHRWRLWCWAWARPPSPSSYPSHASSPLCEVKPLNE